MKNKILAIIVALFVLFTSSITAFANPDLTYCNDNAGLLSLSEEQELDAMLRERSESLKFDIVFVTTDSTDGKTDEEYADDFYDYGGYGYGENHDGCLLLIDMDERGWHISTTGYGINALTDAGIEYIGYKMIDSLKDGDYAEACNTYCDVVCDFVEYCDANNAAYDVDNLEDYDPSYEDYEEESTPFERIATSIIVGLIAGLITTIVVISILKGKMKTVRHKAHADDYLVQNSLVLTECTDVFITSNVTKTAKQSSSSSGGSSTHTGSSGTSHGGGGGHF